MIPIKKIKTYRILRILILLLYVGINVFVLYYSIIKVKYFTLFERVTTLNMLLLLSITLLVPGVLIFVLFMKRDCFVLNIAKGIIQILLIVMIPIVMILGIIIGLRTPSVTTNYTNGQTVKLLVSGSNILIQVLQEAGLSYTGKLNYSFWAM